MAVNAICKHDMFKLGNFTLKNFDLIIRTSDEALLNTVGIPLSSYQATV